MVRVKIFACLILVALTHATRHEAQSSLRQGSVQQPADDDAESVDWPWMHQEASKAAVQEPPWMYQEASKAAVQLTVQKPAQTAPSAGGPPKANSLFRPLRQFHAVSGEESGKESAPLRALAVPPKHHGSKVPLDGDVTLDPSPPSSSWNDEVNAAIDKQLHDRLATHLAAQGATVAAASVPQVPWWVLLIVCIGCVLLVLALIFYFGAIVVGKMIEKSIETFDRRFLGVDIEIGDLSVSLCTGRINMHGCQVANPEGYKSPYLLNASNVVVDLDMKALITSFGNTIEVEEITLEGIDCIVEYDKAFGGTSNVDRVLQHLNKDEKPSEKKAKQVQNAINETGKAPPKKAAGKEIVLHKVGFSGIGATIATKLAGMRFEIPNIKYDDFSKENGAGLLEDIIWIIVNTFCKSLMANITGKSFMDHWSGKD